MTRLRSVLLLSMACNLLTVAAAQAALPSAPNSTTPGFIRLVGYAAAGPDVTDGLFTVIVNDGTGAAIEGSRVTVSFCAVGDLRFCPDQLNPSLTVNCGGGTVSALTDPQGRVDFTILGTGAGLNAPSVRGTVKISADDPVTHQDVLLSDTSPTTGLVCSAPDELGSGLGAADFVPFLNDIGTNHQKSDFDGDGDVDSDDQTILTAIFFSLRMTNNCSEPPVCPTCATPTRTETWGSLKLHYR